MKKILSLIAFSLLSCSISFNQTVTLFSDDFESGTSKWILTGSWGITSTQYMSPSNSLSDSPSGNYGDNVLSYATMATGVDLSAYQSAKLKFLIKYYLELGFDYLYVDITTNDFATFATVDLYEGECPTWEKVEIDIGGYCGYNNVKTRFRFDSDQAYNLDGVYIEDVDVIGSLIDNSPPIIVHNPLSFYEGSLIAHLITADITDYSGIDAINTKLYYKVDNGQMLSVNCVPPTSGTTYSFTIPQQSPGAWVDYWIYAMDSYSQPNSTETDTFRYIAGKHYIYDNGTVDYYGQIGPGVPSVPLGAAVKVTLNNDNLVTLLLRNYTDINHPNNDMLVHIWNDAGGIPGTDVITPLLVSPDATLSNTSAMTRIDIRQYSSQLSNLTGTYYIGFTVPSGVVNITLTQPCFYNRSLNYNGLVWSSAQGTYGCSDYHFRAVTSGTVVNNEDLTNNNNIELFPIPIMDVLYISARKMKGIVNISIYDISGKKLLDLIKNFVGDITNIEEFSSFEKGIYFIKLQDSKESITKKVIKQ